MTDDHVTYTTKDGINLRMVRNPKGSEGGCYVKCGNCNRNESIVCFPDVTTEEISIIEPYICYLCSESGWVTLDLVAEKGINGIE